MKSSLIKSGLMAFALAFPLIGHTEGRPVLELMQLTNSEAIHNSMVEQTQQQIDGMISQLFSQFDDKDPRVTDVMNTYSDGLYELVTASLDWDTAGPKMAAIMESIYTDEEILQLIAFYNSELGQVLRAKEPLVAQELMVNQGKATQEMTAGIQQLMQQLEQDLRDIR